MLRDHGDHREEIRCSRQPDNKLGESCSIALASKNSSSYFHSSRLADRHPRYRAAC
jgi:hypothetical protein